MPVETRGVGQLIAGRLEAHGRAHYRFQTEAELSYYIRVLTSGGARTLWGRDLDRAVHASETKPKVGDLVGVRLTAREAIIRTEHLRDTRDHIIAEGQHKTYRNRWQVEKIAYFSQRATLARRLREVQLDTRRAIVARPELKSSFLTVRAAEAFAQQKIADPRDRERFLEMVREAIAASLPKGQPLPEARLRKPDDLTR